MMAIVIVVHPFRVAKRSEYIYLYEFTANMQTHIQTLEWPTYGDTCLAKVQIPKIYKNEVYHKRNSVKPNQIYNRIMNIMSFIKISPGI